MEITMNGITDIFDFRDLPDGELQIYDEAGKTLIDTSLPEIPIMEARKENGVLTVRFIFSINIIEKDERLLFPKPMTLGEFNDLMDELAERDKPDEVEPDGGVEEDSGDSLEETDDSVNDDHIIDLEEVDF